MPQYFDNQLERQQYLKEHALRLESVLKDMEDLQLKLLALQVEAQYIQQEMNTCIQDEWLSRDLKKKSQ